MREGTDSASRDSFVPKPGLILGFAVVGLVTVVLAGMSAPINGIPPTAEFGLFQLLPPTYWIGLSSMGLAMALALRDRSNGLTVVTGVLFFGVLAGTPILFEPNPRFWDAYFHLGSAQTIGSSGHLPSGLDQYSRNWPGFFLVVLFLSKTGSIAPLQMLALIPFLMGGLTFLALFLFLRSLLPPSLAAFGSVLGSLFSVWSQFHLSPQSVGLFLALLVLAMVWQRSVPLRAAGAILLVGLVVTHPTTTILLLAVLLVHAVIAHRGRGQRSNWT
ncbi:MAG: hypothetical protein GTO63_08145, partial [Anaerolineae bacterium]|nr:hypothetical protein [Anaerolineae bacterium]